MLLTVSFTLVESTQFFFYKRISTKWQQFRTCTATFRTLQILIGFERPSLSIFCVEQSKFQNQKKRHTHAQNMDVCEIMFREI